MTQEFRLADPGEGIHEAEIKEIEVSEGDEVADGDIILTVETDKAAVEVPAPFSGTIEEIRVEVGDVIEVGSVLMTYEKSDEAEAGREETAETDADTEDGKGEEKRDKQNEDATREAATGNKDARDGEVRPVPAAPATRRLARELGVDLRAVEPSGPRGRVTADDVRSAAEERPAEQRTHKAARKTEPREPSELPDFGQWGEIERVPLRSIRRTIARRMAHAWTQIPHVTHQDEVDITDLEQWRRKHKSTAEEHGGKLSLTVLVMKALVSALKEFPRFNASLDPDKEQIVLKRYYHIGIAVDTEQGLMVPVVRDVDRKSILELSTEVVRLAESAREGDLTRQEMQGGTFTITNPGPLGGRMFTPIIDYPQVAILGLGHAALRPIVTGDLDEFEIVPRLMLPICCAFDHRVNDGADAAKFLNLLAETLSDTEAMLLGT